MPNFDKATFIKDLVSNDIDTIISIETIHGSAGSDILTIDNLSTARTPGIGTQGTLNKVVFNAVKTNGEVDKIDAGTSSHLVIMNLSDAAADIYARGGVDKSTQLPGQPDAWFYDPLVTVPAHTISASILSGARIEVQNANYIIGSNIVTSVYDPRTTLWGDWLEGNSNVAETFQGTKGQDTYVVGNGDVLVFIQWANMTNEQAAQVGGWEDYWAGDVIFNGIHLRIFEYNGNNSYYFQYTWIPLTAVYDSNLSKITFTDGRDGSTFRIDGFLPGMYGISLNNMPALAQSNAHDHEMQPDGFEFASPDYLGFHTPYLFL